jgi:Fur family peroxide stress response transcriptional regulator
MNRHPSDAEIIEALRRKGFKATAQRIAICRQVLASGEHPTAQRIYEEVKRTHPTVSLATVYKTLDVLEELNLVQELAVVKSEGRFDPNMEPHVNIACSRCGRITDLEDGKLRGEIEELARKARFTLTGESIILYGVCEKCNGKSRAKIAE